MLLEVYYTRSDLAEVDDGDLTATKSIRFFLFGLFVDDTDPFNMGTSHVIFDPFGKKLISLLRGVIAVVTAFGYVQCQFGLESLSNRTVIYPLVMKLHQ